MAMNWVVNYAMPHLITQSVVYPNHDLKDRKKLIDTEKPYNTKSDGITEDFQMPLHYPRYTKEDYEKMEERRVDMLLRQYGLENHVKGSLDEKRSFAMGTFLWPDQL
ncbi:uncharacterized protein LOC110706970 [Chenopodium quinoa]|uniref:DUF7722 domain-containing protein n=1 Tax=Chenopodium quinoa TaxID=63459 RepID=A0A803LQ44_CHEQI|nr:uncharacterized protein LOC110706970 [Chenopodium quinoa]